MKSYIETIFSITITKRLITFFVVIGMISMVFFRTSPNLAFNIRIRTFLFNAFMLTLALPSIFLVTRYAFGRFFAVFSSIFFYLLAIFPMWILIGDKSRIIIFPNKLSIFGEWNTKWLLVGIILVSSGITLIWNKKKMGNYFPFASLSGNKKNLMFIFAVLLLLSMLQQVFRFGIYTPAGENRIPQNHITVKVGTKYGFHGISYSSTDVHHHVIPGGMFVGDKYDNFLKELVHNDRPTAGYLYSIIAYYFHPYIAARIELFIFYYLIVICVFLLAIEAGFSKVVSLSVALIAMSCDYLLHYSTIINLKIHIFGSQPILLYCMYKIGIFRREFNIKDILMYCALVSFISIGYFPYIYPVFHIVCFIGFFIACDFSHWEKKTGLFIKKNILILILIVLCPIIMKFGWLHMINHYGLQGNPANREINSHYMNKFKEIPKYAVLNPNKFLRTLDENGAQLFRNYIDFERWKILGIVGLLFVFFLPNFVAKEMSIILYSLLISFYIISLGGSLPASFWPHPHWQYNIPLNRLRANGGYISMVFSQIIGILFFTELISRINISKKTYKIGSLIKKNRDKIVLFSSSVIYLLSFLNVFTVWLEFKSTHPMFPYGWSSFGW